MVVKKKKNLSAISCMTKLFKLQKGNTNLIIDENSLVYDLTLGSGDTLELIQENNINLLTNLLYQLELKPNQNIKTLLLEFIDQQQNARVFILQKILGCNIIEAKVLINKYSDKNLKEIINLLVQEDKDVEIDYDNYIYNVLGK